MWRRRLPGDLRRLRQRELLQGSRRRSSKYPRGARWVGLGNLPLRKFPAPSVIVRCVHRVTTLTVILIDCLVFVFVFVSVVVVVSLFVLV